MATKKFIYGIAVVKFNQKEIGYIEKRQLGLGRHKGREYGHRGRTSPRCPGTDAGQQERDHRADVQPHSAGL